MSHIWKVALKANTLSLKVKLQQGVKFLPHASKFCKAVPIPKYFFLASGGFGRKSRAWTGILCKAHSGSEAWTCQNWNLYKVRMLKHFCVPKRTFGCHPQSKVFHQTSMQQGALQTVIVPCHLPLPSRHPLSCLYFFFLLKQAVMHNSDWAPGHHCGQCSVSLGTDVGPLKSD